MRERHEIDPGHAPKRTVLRVAGPILLVIGLGLMVMAAVDFFMAFGGRDAPTLFWGFFAGIPLLFVGLICTALGFQGAIARYHMQEMAPPVKDTFNYMAEGTQGGVRTMAHAVGSGLSSGMAGADAPQARQCPECATANDPDARFCDNCGSQMDVAMTCPDCGEENDPDARFCDNCGRALQDQ
jgi:hypothetical protein